MAKIVDLEQRLMTAVRSLSVDQQEVVLSFVESLRPNVSQPLPQSLQDLAKLPIAERNAILAGYVSAMADDFHNDPALTEFSVLDSEDWDTES